MKKVLVISSSLRHGSNSETLAKEFARGAKDAGNEVEYITLRGKEIKFCMVSVAKKLKNAYSGTMFRKLWGKCMMPMR